jgi:hypothetical protein
MATNIALRHGLEPKDPWPQDNALSQSAGISAGGKP